MSPEQSLIELATARESRRAAKRRFTEAREEHGVCPGDLHGCEVDGPLRCYDAVHEGGELCKVCSVVQPLWVRYQQAATDAGVALRRCIAIGKALGEGGEVQ